MTKWQAVEGLEEVFEKWIDFRCWAYLQLEMRGEWSEERLRQVLDNHERAEQRMKQCKKEIYSDELRMRYNGANREECIACFNNNPKWEEHAKLITAWRSLDGLPPEQA